jgi:Flp pilus assembly protein TadB
MIQRILTALLGVLLFAVAFLVTSLLIAGIVTAGVLTAAWLWWRGRRQVRSDGSRVIEGEYRIIESK